MKKTILTSIFAAVLLLGMVVLLPAHDVAAQADKVGEGVDLVGGGSSPSFEGAIQTIINTFLFLVGAVAVIMIVYGGFRYVTSGGESSAVAAAKNTILYAVVGLVVAILAYAIANFAVGVFDGSSGPTEEECVQSFEEEGRVVEGC